MPRSVEIDFFLKFSFSITNLISFHLKWALTLCQTIVLSWDMSIFDWSRNQHFATCGPQNVGHTLTPVMRNTRKCPRESLMCRKRLLIYERYLIEIMKIPHLTNLSWEPGALEKRFPLFSTKIMPIFSFEQARAQVKYWGEFFIPVWEL